MAKFCIFCGNKPQSKTREHVIPKWLMYVCGDPSKTYNLGFKKDKFLNNEYDVHRFAFKEFVFPACDECNTKYSRLENSVKPIIEKLFSTDSISSNEFIAFLDWMDKVRIGLWLGYYYLDKNWLGIEPKFHVNSRIRAHDRMISIMLLNADNEELSYRGCDMPSFHYTPSVFSIIINNIVIINMSSPFLLARRLGFPFPVQSYMREDGYAVHTVTSGIKRIMAPVISKNFHFKYRHIMQPIYTKMLHLDPGGDLYGDEYVLKHSMPNEPGVGSLFIQTNDKAISIYPDEPSRLWVPDEIYDRSTINPHISILTLQLQLYVDSLAPSLDYLPKEDRLRDSKNRLYAKQVGQRFIQALRFNGKKKGRCAMNPSIFSTSK